MRMNKRISKQHVTNKRNERAANTNQTNHGVLFLFSFSFGILFVVSVFRLNQNDCSECTFSHLAQKKEHTTKCKINKITCRHYYIRHNTRHRVCVCVREGRRVEKQFEAIMSSKTAIATVASQKGNISRANDSKLARKGSERERVDVNRQKLATIQAK